MKKPVVTLAKVANGFEKELTKRHRFPSPNGNGHTVEVSGKLAVLSVIGTLAQEVMLKLEEASARQFRMQECGKSPKERDPEAVVTRMFNVCFKEMKPKIEAVVGRYPDKAPSSPGNSVLWHFHKEWKRDKAGVMAKMREEIASIAKAAKENSRLGDGRG